jgi:hypothetical protein
VSDTDWQDMSTQERRQLWEDLQGAIRALIIEASDVFSAKQAGIMMELVDHDEHGLAFDMLIESVQESEDRLDLAFLRLANQTAIRMHKPVPFPEDRASPGSE